MRSEPYALAIGQLVLGVQSLEFVLRRYLDQVDARGAATDTTAESSISVGDTLSSSVLTNHESLGSLIERFNRSLIAAKLPELALDTTLADVSSVLAMGRIWESDSYEPLRIVQFSMPTNGLVRCTSDQLMDFAWLQTQTGRLRAARANVEEAGRKIQPDRWTPSGQVSRAMNAA